MYKFKHMFRYFSEDFADALTLPLCLCSILNALIEEANLPTIWKSAEVTSSLIQPIKDIADFKTNFINVNIVYDNISF